MHTYHSSPGNHPPAHTPDSSLRREHVYNTAEDERERENEQSSQSPRPQSEIGKLPNQQEHQQHGGQTDIGEKEKGEEEEKEGHPHLRTKKRRRGVLLLVGVELLLMFCMAAWLSYPLIPRFLTGCRRFVGVLDNTYTCL